MKILKRLLISITLFIVLLVAGTTLLVFSQSGTQLLFKLIQKAVPALTVQKVSGNLDNLVLKNVNYQQAGIKVTVGELTLHGELLSLIRGNLLLNKLSVTQLAVKVNTTLLPVEAAHSTTQTGTFSLPINLDLQQFIVNDATVNIDGNQVNIADFSTQLRWSGMNMRVSNPTVTNMVVKLAKQTQPVKPVIAKRTSQQTLQQKITDVLQQIKTQLNQPIQLPDINFPLNVTIQNFTLNQFRFSGATSFEISQLILSGSVINSEVALSHCYINSPYGSLNLTGDINLTQGWSMDFSGNGQLIQPIQEKITLILQGNVNSGLQVQLISSGHFNTQLQLKLALENKQAPLLLTFTSSGMQWPLTGQAQFSLTQAQLLLKGTLQHYQLSGDVKLKLTGQPDINIQLQGSGTTTQFNLTSLLIKFKDAGEVCLSSKINWSDQLSLISQLYFKQFKLGHFSSLFNKSQLDGSIGLHVVYKLDDWSIAFDNIKLDGKLNGEKIKLTGGVFGTNNKGWEFKQVMLALGVNRIMLQGRYQKVSNLILQIDAPDLDNLLPGLKGSIIGKITLQGTLQYPQIHSDVNVNNFEWQNYSVTQLSLQGQVGGTKQLTGNLQLLLGNVHYGSQVVLQRVKLTLDGSELQHTLKVAIVGKPITTHIDIIGHFNRQTMTWQADFQNATLQSKFGNWALQHPMQLSYNFVRQQLSLTPQCWSGTVGQLCVTDNSTLSPEVGSIALQVKQLKLSLLNPELRANNIALDGSINAQGVLAWNHVNQKLQPHVKFTLETTGVGLTDLITQHTHSLLKSSHFQFLVEPNIAKLNLSLMPSQGAAIQAKLQVNDPATQRLLTGYLTIPSFDFSQLQSFLPNDEALTGQLSAHLKLSGTLALPQLFGKISAENLKLQDAKLPLQLDNGQLSLDFLGNSSNLAAKLHFAQGELELKGNSDWSNILQPKTQLNIDGQNIRVQIPLYGDVTLSPHIKLQGISRHIQLSGGLAIPEANIKIKSLPPSVVEISNDQVLLDDQLKPMSAKQQPLMVDGQLKVTLGKQVAFAGFGLTTELNGSTILLLNKNKVALHGNIALINGKYQAYGQNLLIRKGQINFSGPLSVTGLNIEAIRNPDSISNNVTAGIKVTGTIQHPKVSLFSQPSMPQQQILSYVLRGQSLDEGDDNSSLATTLLLSLGSSTGTNILKKLASPLGIKDVSIGSKGTGQQSQVVVSGYILPKLKVEYGMGLFDSLATLTLRYQLFSQLYIEATSGLNQSLELLYQFSFN